MPERPPERPEVVRSRSARTPPVQDDGTRQLLQGGGGMTAVGVVSAVLLQTVLGGFSPTGASTNGGWFALIVALMCIPFGGLLLALGIAKWLRNRSLAKRRG
jgi:hypothetical protein